MLSKAFRKLKSVSRRTKLLTLEVGILIGLTVIAVASAFNSECGQLVRHEILRAAAAGMLLGLMLALHRLAMG